jgi:hypothetical protein
MSVKVLQDQDFTGGARIRNLSAPANSDEPVRLADLNSAIEGVAWKDSVRVGASANVNTASPGATIDGITMAVNDRVLLRGQTTASQNGIWIWIGAAVAMTRAVDASTFAELEAAVVTVEEGTDAGTTWRQTQVNGVLDTNNIAWTAFGTSAPSASETTAGIAELATQAETDTGTDDARIVTPLKLATYAGRAKKNQANIGDGSATQFTVTHNLNTRDVLVQVIRNSAPYDNVIVDMERDTVNSVVLRFASAPTPNQYRVLIIG